MAKLTLTNGWTMINRNVDNVAKTTKELLELTLRNIGWQVADEDGASLDLIALNVGLSGELGMRDSRLSTERRGIAIIALGLKVPLIGIMKLL
jgi:hypothetical protein